MLDLIVENNNIIKSFNLLLNMDYSELDERILILSLGNKRYHPYKINMEDPRVFVPDLNKPGLDIGRMHLVPPQYNDEEKRDSLEESAEYIRNRLRAGMIYDKVIEGLYNIVNVLSFQGASIKYAYQHGLYIPDKILKLYKA